MSQPPEPNGIVSIGTRVLLEDLDDGSCEEYVLVPPAESNPAAGRLSSESPVGLAIRGHRKGEVVAARAPHRVRHLRILDAPRRKPTTASDRRSGSGT